MSFRIAPPAAVNPARNAPATSRPATMSEQMMTILRCGVFLWIQPPIAKLPWSVVSITRKSQGIALPGAVISFENATGTTRGICCWLT